MVTLHALLKLSNRIKAEQKYPEVLEIYDKSSIYKNKGSRNSFNSYRGIFRVPIFRAILDRLIYNDEYGDIDEAMSDSNVGARKGRNIRDNIFVLNAVLNSVVNGKEEPIDVQVYDIQKCFDASMIYMMQDSTMTSFLYCFWRIRMPTLQLNLHMEYQTEHPLRMSSCRERCGEASAARPVWTS